MDWKPGLLKCLRVKALQLPPPQPPTHPSPTHTHTIAALKRSAALPISGPGRHVEEVCRAQHKPNGPTRLIYSNKVPQKRTHNPIRFPCLVFHTISRLLAYAYTHIQLQRYRCSCAGFPCTRPNIWQLDIITKHDKQRSTY